MAKMFEVENCIAIHEDGKVEFYPLDAISTTSNTNFANNDEYANFICKCFGCDSNAVSFDPTRGTGTVVIDSPNRQMLLSGINALIDKCGNLYSSYDSKQMHEAKMIKLMDESINAVLSDTLTDDQKDEIVKTSLNEFINSCFNQYINSSSN